MKLTKEQLVAEFNAKKKPNFDAAAEASHVIALLEDRDVAAILSGYDYKRFIAAGGSGLVFEITDKTSHAGRALKISRVKAPEGEFGPTNPVNVELEIEALALVGHQNITRFYAGQKLGSGAYVIVTQLVHEPASIDEWVRDVLLPDIERKSKKNNSESQLSARAYGEARTTAEENKHTEPPQSSESSAEAFAAYKATSERQISDALIALAEKLLGYAQALAYMHNKHRLYHMDIKPGNLLVGGDGTPFVTDLGFARWRDRFKDDEKVPVGFTYGFHHPQLTELRGFGVPSTPARAHNTLAGKELGPKFDVYSFGRTALALLKIFEDRFGKRIRGNYNFLYLHLMASLMLDRRNQETPPRPSEMFCQEVALEFRDNLLEAFSFSSFDEVVDRCERLLGRKPIEHRIPELNPWYPRSVNHGVGFLNLTPRVQSIIQHPAFRRLRGVKQLGNVDEVYSAASHTRYAHSQGVTGMVCACIQALYNDVHNPIFKLLVTDKDVLEVIAAALLHDLGQSSHGHDLEELDDVFAHNEITRRIINHAGYKDAGGRSLLKIISGSEVDDWALDSEQIAKILSKNAEISRFHAFRDLLDGPVDADKLDYLVRDGRASGVRHGDALDIHRLLRCLTVLPVKNPSNHRMQLCLGVKEKGLPTSEMVVLVRQKMYASIYLHHAAREVKSMVGAACAAGLKRFREDLREFLMYPNDLIQELYTSLLIGVEPDLSKLPLKETEKKRILKFWNDKRALIKESDHDISIQFLEPFCGPQEMILLRDVADRRLYKRLWERSFASLGGENMERVRKLMDWPIRAQTVGSIEQELLGIIEKTLQNKSAVASSLNEIPLGVQRFRQSNRLLLIGDMPFRGFGPGGKPPPILSDIARKRGNYGTDEGSARVASHVWREGARKMMDEACFCRIFAEPDFHDFIFGVIDQEGVDSAVAKVLNL